MVGYTFDIAILMMQCEVLITVIQTPNEAFPTRNRTFTFNYASKIEIQSSWKSLTDKATVVIPKNIYMTDAVTKKLIPLGGKYNPKIPNNIVIGGFLLSANSIPMPPVFMRGDQISIALGYTYPSSESGGIYTYTTTMNTRFTGYIAEVDAKIPITLKCEDNMWKLKQLIPPIKAYPAAMNNLDTLLADLSTDSGFDIVQGTPGNPWNVNMGDFRTKGESWAGILNRLRKPPYNLYFYFRGNALRGGGIVYYPEDMQTVGNFYFEGAQGNIFPNDHLTYSRKDDVLIGAQCYSVNKVLGTKTNARGGTRTSDQRLSVVVGADKTAATEFFTFFFRNVNSVATLKQLGQTQLNRFYYDGVRGKFTSFGLPFMQHGNLAKLSSILMPERNGTYLIKGVNTRFEANGGESGGLQQEIELHFRTDSLSQADFNNLLNNGG